MIGVREDTLAAISKAPTAGNAPFTFLFYATTAIAASAGEDTVDDRIDEGESDSVLDMVFILIG